MYEMYNMSMRSSNEATGLSGGGMPNTIGAEAGAGSQPHFAPG